MCLFVCTERPPVMQCTVLLNILTVACMYTRLHVRCCGGCGPTCKLPSGGTAAAGVPHHRCWRTHPPPQASFGTGAPCMQRQAVRSHDKLVSTKPRGRPFARPPLATARSFPHPRPPHPTAATRATQAQLDPYPLHQGVQAPTQQPGPLPYLSARSSASICCSRASRLCMSLCLNQRTRALLSLAPCTPQHQHRGQGKTSGWHQY